jgi:quinol monooxygenase YgiN
MSQQGAGKVAIILHLEVAPARVAEFLEVAAYDAEQTIAEPGCDTFDVLRTGATSFVFYEIYHR